MATIVAESFVNLKETAYQKKKFLRCSFADNIQNMWITHMYQEKKRKGTFSENRDGGGLYCFRQCVKTRITNEVWIKANEEQITSIIAISPLTQIHEPPVGLISSKVGTVLKISFTQTILNLTHAHWVWLLKPIKFWKTIFVALISFRFYFW